MGILRVLLALSVVFTHIETGYKIKLLPGYVAVQAFFIISGFYMSLILNNKYVGKNSYQLFYKNRFLRLYPMYLVVLIGTITVSIISALFFNKGLSLTPYIDWIGTMKPSTLAFLVMTNLFLFGQDIVMFLGYEPNNGTLFATSDFMLSNPKAFQFLLVPQAWSLSVEILFYFIAPFLLRKKISLLLVLTLLSFSLRIFIYRYLGFSNDPWTYRFFPTELAFFLSGAIAYKLYERISSRIQLSHCIIPSTLLFIVLIGYHFINFPSSKDWFFYALTLICLPFVFHLTKHNKFDRRIGELSYPIYIVHIFIIKILKILLFKIGATQFMTILTCFLSITAAWILLKIIADPIEEMRKANFLNYSKTAKEQITS